MFFRYPLSHRSSSIKSARFFHHLHFAYCLCSSLKIWIGARGRPDELKWALNHTLRSFLFVKEWPLRCLRRTRLPRHFTLATLSCTQLNAPSSMYVTSLIPVLPRSKMLSYPDRHRFEEIRSQWEAAQVGNGDTQLRMVGRKEKPTAQLLSGDESTNASKFRRKLSQGLSLISLSQRKTTPVRPSLPSTDLSSPTDVPHPRESTRLLSPMRNLSSCGVSVHDLTQEKTGTPPRDLIPDAVHKQLPRSRTMSFIPRPSQTEFASPVLGSEPAHKSGLSYTLEEEPCVTPTQDPLSDVATFPRQSPSSRRYVFGLTTQEENTSVEHAVGGVKDHSPSKPSPMRSYTTPNLARTAHSHVAGSLTSPRRSNQHRLSGIPGPPRPNLKENSTPIAQRHIKRLSNIQEHSPQSLRRESLMASTMTSKRRSVELASVSATSKQRACATPPASSKRKHAQNVAQTPFAAQRAVPKKRSPAHPVGSWPVPNEDTHTKAYLLGPVSPLTSKETSHAAARSSLPRAITEKDLRKRTFPATKKRTGGTVLTRSLAMANNEVRLPRPSTFHHLVSVEDVPPVPTIPEKYKSASMSMLVTAEEPSEIRAISPTGTIYEQMISETSSVASDSSITVLPVVLKSVDVQQNSDIGELRLKKPRLSGKKSKLNIRIPTPGRSFSTSFLFSAKSSSMWSGKTSQVMDVADIDVSLQWKDYMPALYWAGRFQSRYDQWRTEAMQGELNPNYHMSGPLAHCNVHQENIAACHIFLQLREMCLSAQAADSLWVSKGALTWYDVPYI